MCTLAFVIAVVNPSLRMRPIMEIACKYSTFVISYLIRARTSFYIQSAACKLHVVLSAGQRSYDMITDQEMGSKTRGKLRTESGQSGE